MKKIPSIVFSVPTTAILLLAIAITIAWGTFVENSSGTNAARSVVYDSWWFIGLLILLIVNLVGSIITNKLISKKKWAILVFHFSFILIIIGGGVTKLTRMEGTMHLDEGQVKSKFLTDDAYLEIMAVDSGKAYRSDWKTRFSDRTKNNFRKSISLGEKELDVELAGFVSGTRGYTRSEIPDDDSLTFRILGDGLEEQILVTGRKGVLAGHKNVIIDDIRLRISYGSVERKLPFSLQLHDLQVDRYPGSNSPSSITSEVIILDHENKEAIPFSIGMNNVMRFKGYRIFQSTHDDDRLGCTFNVNYDSWGTTITYFGYFLMILGMIFTLFSKSSRFRAAVKGLVNLRKAGKAVLGIVLITAFAGMARGQEIRIHNLIDENHKREFSELLVQSQDGRIEPVSTLASKIVRKVHGKRRIGGQDPAASILSMISDPANWMNMPVIRVESKELAQNLGLHGEYTSFNFIMEGGYKLAGEVEEAYKKKESERTAYDRDVLSTDERVNVFYMAIRGEFLRIFPVPGDPGNTWVFLGNRDKTLPPEINELAIRSFTAYISSVAEAKRTGDWQQAGMLLNDLKSLQERYAGELVPVKTKIRLEVLYNKVDIFGKLGWIYGLIGLVFLVYSFLILFRNGLELNVIKNTGTGIVALLFALHTAGLAVRWYLSGHAPWSDGYESMIFISWTAVLAGIFIGRRSITGMAVTNILAAIILLVAGMSWMNPAITNITPVLDSFWLIIHVALVAAGYGFLGVGALLGAMNLVLMIIRSGKNFERINIRIEELSYIITISLTIGLFMMTTGSFLGGVWANESWGRYWGWDPKESWSLITILVYAFIVHMHRIPFLKNHYALSSAALIGFGTVIMTYFGVNYYFTGLHSYATGTAAGLPGWMAVVVGMVVVLLISAAFRIKGSKNP